MFKVKFSIGLLSLLLSVALTSCSIIQENSSSSQANSTELSKEDKFRHEVVSYAKEQLGSRYRYAGKDPRGFDCSGFTYYVMDKFDITLSSSSKFQAKEGESIDVKKAKTGDLIIFKRSKIAKPFHVALVVSNNRSGIKVIHSTSRGVVIDNITSSDYWKPKISSARDVISANI